MSGLRHLRLFQMRQLYLICVTPVIDYINTVWHDPFKDKIYLRSLYTIQRDTFIKIFSAFKTVANQILKIEVYVSSTRLRFKKRGQNMVARLFILFQDYLIQSVLERINRKIIAKNNNLRLFIARLIQTMDKIKLRALEMINLTSLKS